MIPVTVREAPQGSAWGADRDRQLLTGPDGALIAQAAGSVLILPGRHWERPVHVADEITAESGRVLTTVLFTDIVGSTRRAAELGDDRWRQVLAEHHAIVREQIRRFRGREVDTAGPASRPEPSYSVALCDTARPGLPAGDPAGDLRVARPVRLRRRCRTGPRPARSQRILVSRRRPCRDVRWGR
jgi:class 3 adenylate cyclase